jgi:hypothetical protein
MEPTSPGRTCPRCGSTEYLFRGRKKVAAEAGKPEAVETECRCKACGHEESGTRITARRCCRGTPGP